MSSITLEAVVERARRITDVEDPDPTHFIDNLGAVIQAMNGEAQLTPEGVDRETVADAFAGYIERFDIPSEHGDGG